LHRSRDSVDEIIGGWRKPHNEELYNLYTSPNIIRMVRSRRMRWKGHVARMKRSAHRILARKPEKNRDHYEDIGVDERIILK
jgi:branched-subunit amino acid aminotransferase/4-amino-4-deoxychorismate lyase